VPKNTRIRDASVNILIVEDERALRVAVLLMLQKEGFSVLEASDGTKAIELIRAQKQNLGVLVLDVSLPGATSREVLEEAERLIPGIVVIVTTSYSKEIAAALLATEVRHFVQKPYRFRQLLDNIREVQSIRLGSVPPVATPAGSISDAEHWAQLSFLALELSRRLRTLARTQRRTTAQWPSLDTMLRRMRAVAQALHDSGCELGLDCAPEFPQQRCIPKVTGFELGPPGGRL
jgi:DNA-binding response OmpR family regulator